MTLTLQRTTFADEFTQHWRPRAPLAGDVKAETVNMKRRNRTVALQHPHIEANPLALKSLVITDHDGADAEHIAEIAGLPQPSYVAMNPHTQSGHIVYALATPVILTNAASRRPVNYLARIEAGLADVLQGDLGFTGRITKNPYHQAHLPIWGAASAVYTLKELADPLREIGALPKYSRSNVARSAVGRNCALFDLMRRWAYRAWERYALDPVSVWEEVCIAYALDRNLSIIGEEFTCGPMTEQEVIHLARSVARWTSRTFVQQGGLDAYRQRFKELQSARGKIMTEKKREANRKRRLKIDPSEFYEEAF